MWFERFWDLGDMIFSGSVGMKDLYDFHITVRSGSVR